MSAGPRGGFNLLEVVVALVLLQLSLLGVLGLFTLASGRLRRAMLLERAVVEASVVADSLSSFGRSTAGEAVRGAWRVSWEPSGEGLLVRAELLGAGAADPLVELRVP